MNIAFPFENEDLLIDFRTVGSFMTNSFLVMCKKTKEALLIDSCAEFSVLKDMIESHGAKIVYLAQTHAHLDHVAALKETEEHYKVPIILNRDEMVLYEQIPTQCRMFGIKAFPIPPTPSKWLEEGDAFSFGECQVTTWQTPGHTPGSLTFFVNEKWAFVGDVLFKGSIGRVDLPGGDWKTMEKTLKRFTRLEDQTVILSGHGDVTTMKREKRYNPFLLDLM